MAFISHRRKILTDKKCKNAPLPSNQKISIVIITHNRKQKLSRLVGSLVCQDLASVNEIIIVNDCSSDGTSEMLKQTYGDHQKVKIFTNSTNMMASASRNRGADAATGDFIIFLDDDVVVKNTFINDFINEINIKGSEATILSPIMFEFKFSEITWFKGMRLNMWTTHGTFIEQGKPKDQLDKSIDWLPSDALVTAFGLRKADYIEIGGFDEENFPFQFEEMDFFVRARYLGYRLQVSTAIELFHDHEVGSFLNNPWRSYYTAKNRLLICKLWSTSRLQYWVAMFFAFVHLAAYVLLKFTRYKQRRMDCFRALYDGTLDGLKTVGGVVPYRSRQGYRTCLFLQSSVEHQFKQKLSPAR